MLPYRGVNVHIIRAHHDVASILHLCRILLLESLLGYSQLPNLSLGHF